MVHVLQQSESPQNALVVRITLIDIIAKILFYFVCHPSAAATTISKVAIYIFMLCFSHGMVRIGTCLVVPWSNISMLFMSSCFV